ncbi:MAG TPA: SLC13/DASS family transporter, partial [Firmicutes bacterium]|nr:SLC13/DASS family transporter [Bacillota bacterium]
MGERGWRARFDARTAALLAGPLIAVLLAAFADLEPAQPAVTRMAAVALWMAIWWITEAVPLAVTALLPVALFPLLSIMSTKQVAPLYFNSIIFLFIGGFIIALAMQRCDLHKRIALHIIRVMGLSPGRLLLGFMVATAFLSMWISNTATTMMMVPIALAVIIRMEQLAETGGRSHYAVGLLLAVAYAASIGGIATLVGTPPNLSFARIFAISFEQAPEVSFSQWIIFALPLSLVMLVLTWLFLRRMYAPATSGLTNRSIFDSELRALGRMTH